MAQATIQLPPDSTGKLVDAYTYTGAGAATVYAQSQVPVGTDGGPLMPVAAALGDGMANPTASKIAALNATWNGATWDRTISANAADGTSGTGLAGAGMLGYDGSAWRRVSAVQGDGTGQTAQLVTGGRKEITFSVGPNSNVVYDVSNYAHMSINTMNLGGASFFIESSDDNSYFVGMTLLSEPAQSWTTNLSASQLYTGPLRSRYLRLRNTSGTATVTGQLELFAMSRVYTQMQVTNNSASNLAVLPQLQTPSDAVGNSSTAFFWPSFVYNGTTWDRVRSATAASNTTGVGVAASGTMIYDGTNWQAAGGYAGDTGQNGQVIAGGRKEVTFSTTTAQAVASTDVSNYRWATVHLTSMGTGANVTFQGSNDNVNWLSLPMYQLNASAPGTGGGVAGVAWHGPMPLRYFRINVTGISAGTTAGVIEFYSVPPPMPSNGFTVGISGNVTVAGTTTPGDSMANNFQQFGVSNLVYNGTTWDMMRSATAASNTTGKGVIAAGGMIYDGTNWQVAGGFAGDSGQNAAIIAGGRKEVSFSTTTAQAVASTDVSNYRFVSVQFTAQGTGSTVTFQASNDNANWFSVPLVQYNAIGSNPATSTTLVSMYYGSLPFRYFRLNVTGISAGTTSGIAEFLTMAPPMMSQAAYVNNTVSVAGTDGSTARAIPVGGIADTLTAAGQATTPAAGAAIATIAAPGAGTYRIVVSAWAQSASLGDSVNMQLKHGATAVGTVLANNQPSGQAGVATTSVFERVTILAAEALTVNAIALGAGTYSASIQATRLY